MSEAILYAIDAPQVKNADAAAKFVEKWQDSADAPTARIATLFVRLLQTWPEDGSKGVVWHEDFRHNRPTGSMLAMTFELSEFDAERLQHLRAIAKHHGVHVFDPEGHVLYLADGSEAGVPAMAVPARGAPSAHPACASTASTNPGWRRAGAICASPPMARSSGKASGGASRRAP